MVNIVLQARKFQMVCYLNWPTCSLAFMLLMEACNKGEFHSCSMILVWALYSDGKVQVLSDFNHIWLLPKNLNGRMKASRQLLSQEKILPLQPTSLLTQYIYHISSYMMRSLLLTLADDRVLFLYQIWLRYDTQ